MDRSRTRLRVLFLPAPFVLTGFPRKTSGDGIPNNIELLVSEIHVVAYDSVKGFWKPERPTSPQQPIYAMDKGALYRIHDFGQRMTLFVLLPHLKGSK